jgi:predicted acylesterase/phospholipase RssA
MEQEKPFQIGICMAGAVSAGAYTAGVMDYLLEAISEWEKRRALPNVPSHKVVIPIMGGASAGGMTALLTAATINNSITPVQIPQQEHMLDEHPENKLYNSWVDLLHKDMFPIMLNTGDIKSGEVLSLLNSEFIDKIADKMITADTNNWQPSHPAFKFPVKVFTTLSNLEGFRYNIGLNTGEKLEKYNMTIHNDYACFEMLSDALRTSGTGGGEKVLNGRSGDHKVTSNGWMPLDFQLGVNVTAAKEAAMATGAFPVGLKSREVNRHSSHLMANPWLEGIFKNTPLSDGNIKTLNVDGGMINNEPFEKVRDMLDRQMLIDYNMSQATEEQKQKVKDLNCSYDTFENTVLMIDPFPSKENELFKFDKDITSIISKTLSAMTAQMRSKPLDYKKAMTENDPGQFIVSPSRDIPGNNGDHIEKLFGEKAIACGSLAGFGGFLSKEFRIHDFYLGRYNCEIFLRDYFTIPQDAKSVNPIFRSGYENVSGTKHISTKTGGFQIIPIFKDPPTAFPMPTFSGGSNWPVIKEEELERFKKPLRKRVEKILLNMAELNTVNNALLWICARVIINRVLAAKALSAIQASMVDWKLLKK